MAFLVGLVAEAGTAVAASGLEAAGVAGAEVAGAEVAEASTAEALASQEMMTAPEGMVDESQEVINETQKESPSSPQQQEKKEAGTSLNVENELKKNFIQQQCQEAEKRRKEVESQLKL